LIGNLFVSLVEFKLSFHILAGIRTNVDRIWWGVVRMCQPIIAISSVYRNTIASLPPDKQIFNFLKKQGSPLKKLNFSIFAF
jgi:hypothetical protein